MAAGKQRVLWSDELAMTVSGTCGGGLYLKPSSDLNLPQCTSMTVKHSSSLMLRRYFSYHIMWETCFCLWMWKLTDTSIESYHVNSFFVSASATCKYSQTLSDIYKEWVHWGERKLDQYEVSKAEREKERKCWHIHLLWGMQVRSGTMMWTTLLSSPVW